MVKESNALLAYLGYMHTQKFCEIPRKASNRFLRKWQKLHGIYFLPHK